MLRLIFFGMTGQFSIAPLKKLLQAGVDLGAVVVPVTPGALQPVPHRVEPPSTPAADLPLLNPHVEENIVHLAWTRNIPVWQVDTLSGAQTQTLLADLQPDLMVVACFPHIFPPELLQLPQYGCLNLHPSLLPAYRGPAPLFWIARNDEQTTGVTLHFLDEGLDTGDIVAQTHIDRVEGMTETELDRRCAEEGAKLLLSAVQQLEQGQPLSRRPQSKIGASYFPWPNESDLIIPIDWPARRAFNFARGAENWPLVIHFDDDQFCIRIAKSYAPDQTLNQPYILLGDELWVQFQPGVLRAKIF